MAKRRRRKTAKKSQKPPRAAVSAAPTKALAVIPEELKDDRILTGEAKRRLFVHYFLAGPPSIRGNGAACVQAAGYHGSTPLSRAVMASRLLSREDVKQAVRRHLERLDITAERVLSEIAKIAYANVGKVASWTADGVTLVPSTELDEDETAAIAEVSEQVGEWGTSVRVRMHDKLAALALHAKYLKLLGEGGKDQAPDRFTLVIGENVQINQGALSGDAPKPVAAPATPTGFTLDLGNGHRNGAKKNGHHSPPPPPRREGEST